MTAPIPIGCLPYPTDWPTECFAGLRTLYANGELFSNLAATHHHVWTIQGFLAGKFLVDEPTPGPDPAPLRPIGETCPCPDDCKAELQALAAEADGIKAACGASQGVIADTLKSLLAEALRQGLPKLLDVLNGYLDKIGV